MDARRWTACAGLALLLLAGCGAGSAPGSGNSQTGALPVSGNWTFSPSTASRQISLPPFVGGSLAVKGSQVNADFMVFLVADTSCSLTSDLGVTLTGSVTNSILKLTSASWNGGVFTVNGSVAADGKTITATWSVSGGCADGQSGSTIATYVPPLTGTWTGTASEVVSGTTSPLVGAAVTLNLQQGATANQFTFPLSGSVTLSGTSCGFTNGTVIQLSNLTPLAPSSIVGQEWTLEAQMDDGRSLALLAGVPNLTKAGGWTAVIVIAGGSCNGAIGQASLGQS